MEKNCSSVHPAHSGWTLLEDRRGESVMAVLEGSLQVMDREPFEGCHRRTEWIPSVDVCKGTVRRGIAQAKVWRWRDSARNCRRPVWRESSRRHLREGGHPQPFISLLSFLVVTVLLFSDRVSLCSGTHSVDQASLQCRALTPAEFLE